MLEELSPHKPGLDRTTLVSGPVGRLELRRCQVIQSRVNALGLIDIFDEMTDPIIGIPIVNVVCQIYVLFLDGASSSLGRFNTESDPMPG